MMDEDSLFGRATKEEDEPLCLDYKAEECGAGCTGDLEAQKLKMKVDENERQEKRYFNAVKIFIICLAFLGIVYAIDVLASAFLKKELSSLTDGVTEIIKTLLFSLSGYLFARNDNK